MFFPYHFIQLRRTRHLADAALDALNASYANTGFIGFPLVIVFLGHEALAPTLVTTIQTVSVLFGIGIIIIETGLQGEVKRRIIFAKVAKSLMKNPLLVSPAVAIFIPVKEQNICKLAEHLDLDVLNPDVFCSLLFAEHEPEFDWQAVYPVGKLNLAQMLRIIRDVSAETEIVVIGITEHLP